MEKRESDLEEQCMQQQLVRILADHARRYPRMQIADLYKLLHQAAMGSEHAVSDKEGVRAWLERELATMGPGAEEPLVDPISPGGEIVRVHLRPFVAAGYDPEGLLDAFLRTAREWQGSVERLRLYWAAAEQMVTLGQLRFAQEQIVDFGQHLASQGFPAAHHSAAYQQAYRPAYRVVVRACLPRALLSPLL
jgi:hypothetical protein